MKAKKYFLDWWVEILLWKLFAKSIFEWKPWKQKLFLWLILWFINVSLNHSGQPRGQTEGQQASVRTVQRILLAHNLSYEKEGKKTKGKKRPEEISQSEILNPKKTSHTTWTLNLFYKLWRHITHYFMFNVNVLWLVFS